MRFAAPSIRTPPEARADLFREAEGRRSPRNREAGESGFTLAEVLAALVFMAIVIPVALEGISIAGRAGEVAARKSEAAMVAEQMLSQSVVTTNWNGGAQNGTVHQGNRDFRWTLRNESWNADVTETEMRLLSVEVAYQAQGHDYSVRLSTLVDNAPLLAYTNSAP